MFSAFVTITYSLSLRGPEGFLVDPRGTRLHWKKGLLRYFLIALLRKVKGETNDRAHLLPCVCDTSSGIPTPTANSPKTNIILEEEGRICSRSSYLKLSRKVLTTSEEMHA